MKNLWLALTASFISVFIIPASQNQRESLGLVDYAIYDKPHAPNNDIPLMVVNEFVCYVEYLQRQPIASRLKLLSGFDPQVLVSVIEYEPKTKAKMEKWLSEYYQQYLNYLKNVEQFNLRYTENYIPQRPISFAHLSVMQVKVQAVDYDPNKDEMIYLEDTIKLHSQWILDTDPDYDQIEIFFRNLHELWKKYNDSHDCKQKLK